MSLQLQGLQHSIRILLHILIWTLPSLDFFIMLQFFIGFQFLVVFCFYYVFFRCYFYYVDDAHLKQQDRAVSGARFLTGGVFECRSVAVLLCCIRSGVTRCTLLMVLYVDRMCQCGLHAALWSHIGIIMRLLAAEPRSTAGPLFTPSVPLERSY